MDAPPDGFALLLVPLLALAHTCGVVGSFVLWRLRIVRAMGAAVPFRLHVFHDGASSIGQATLALALGVAALALPLSLILRVLG